MPLKWERHVNPFVHTHFGRLRLGPNASRRQINDTAAELLKKLVAGHKITIGGVELDEFAISDASKKLLEPGPLALELLLTHPQPREDGHKTKKLCEQVRKVGLPAEPRRMTLVHPAAVFWFTPTPGPEVLPLPHWEDLDTVRAGSDEDLDLDCAFDH